MDTTVFAVISVADAHLTTVVLGENARCCRSL